ncbi:tetratricopeptide repeat protein [Spirosoma jeollabukense]
MIHPPFSVADWEALTASLLTYQPPSWQGSEKADSESFTGILTLLSRQKAGSYWRTVNYLWDRYDGGLKYARQGKLSSAEQVFAEADTTRKPFVKIAMLDQLIDVLALPAIAYLRYKQEKYDEAEHLLIKSIDSDAELLAEDIYILTYHRVQQLHNLARLLFQQGRLNEGAQMIAMALKFLVYRQVPAVGNGKGWLDEKAYLIPSQLRYSMLWQLTIETVGIFLMYPTEWDTLSQLAFGNMTYWDAQTPDETRMLAWFTLIEPGHSDYWQINVLGLITFLTTSPSLLDQLKMALILQIVATSNQSSLVASGLPESIENFMNQLQLSQSQRESCSLFVNQLLIRSL